MNFITLVCFIVRTLDKKYRQKQQNKTHTQNPQFYKAVRLAIPPWRMVGFTSHMHTSQVKGKQERERFKPISTNENCLLFQLDFVWCCRVCAKHTSSARVPKAPFSPAATRLLLKVIPDITRSASYNDTTKSRLFQPEQMTETHRRHVKLTGSICVLYPGAHG